jgi:hypothetical protein
MASITTPSYQYTASDAPEYKGLMGGDYDKLQQALYDPAAIAAKTAYQQGVNNLNNTMGGRGLYGSSIMQNQANQGINTVYQNTLASAASNAAAKRYELQQSGLNNQNAFNKDLYGLGLTRESGINQYGLNRAGQDATQEANIWKAMQTEAARKQGYYQNQDQLALQYQQLANQNDLSNKQLNAQQTAGYLGAGGTVLGGLLSAQGQSALGSLYNTVSGWLGGGDSYSYGDFANESDWSDWWSDSSNW